MKRAIFAVAAVMGLVVVGSAYGQDSTTLLTYFLNDLRAGFIGVNLPTGFKATSGTATAPSITFSAQPGLGIYRQSANVIGFANDGYSTTPNAILTSSGFVLAGTSQGFGFAPAADATTAADTRITRVGAGEFGWTAVLFANLGTPASGTFAYCSDCTIANPCASGGSGALAKRLNGVWVCN